SDSKAPSNYIAFFCFFFFQHYTVFKVHLPWRSFVSRDSLYILANTPQIVNTFFKSFLSFFVHTRFFPNFGAFWEEKVF
ncbi:MAG: hypothetical protein IJO10_09235, partial [Clostridia bacterium]|nr:hypothetical protein [Clostridia bacterium]